VPKLSNKPKGQGNRKFAFYTLFLKTKTKTKYKLPDNPQGNSRKVDMWEPRNHILNLGNPR
jgi:hypothetical protein